MKGRESKGPPSTDLLVCFPSRAHLTLMPKPICSPARHSEPNKRHHHHKKLTVRSGGQASPLLWAKSKASEIAEPTSPKVTCAGQIKVRPGRPVKPDSCKNWQSVMEEIERLHKSQKYKRKPAWIETTFGFKKDVMQFLTCLRNITFDFRCFGSFPSADVTSDDEDEDEEDEEEEDFQDKGNKGNNESESSRTMFSKWFMVLQENQNPEPKSTEEARDDSEEKGPPPNALLLMRCRSAPAKSWLEERHEKQEEKEEEDLEKLKMAVEEEESNNEKNKKKENLVVMRYGKDFYKFSSDIAKETWVVGGITDPLSRSRSWKR